MAILFDYVLPFLLLIGVLVFVHEMGHYLAARIMGIHVTHFAIGMGPVLYRRPDRRGCMWQICAFPVGGYVRMQGDGILDQVDAVEARDRRSPAYNHRPPLHRMFVVAAGPFANIVLGVVIVAGLYIGYGRPFSEPVAASLIPDSPAAVAGILPGDRILSADGVEVERFEDLQAAVVQRPGKPVLIEVARPTAGGSERLGFTVVPEAVRSVDMFGSEGVVGRIGINSPGPSVRRMGPAEAVTAGIQDVWYMSGAMLSAIGDMVTGKRSVEELGGPVKIAEISGTAADQGLGTLILFAGIISINLAIANLLPIPVLDGGHLVLQTVELLIGRPLNRKFMVWTQRGGVAVLLALFLFVTANDIIGLMGMSAAVFP